MKKILFAIFIAVFTITSINAQTYGVKAGVNLSKYTYNYNSSFDEYQKMFFGFHIGGFTEFEITDQFTFQPELVYYLQGNKHKINENLELTSKQSYLNLPLMLKYYITNYISVQTGPQIGFLLASKDNFKGTNLLLPDGNTGADDLFSNSNSSVDTKDDYKNIDFGLNFGAGYKMENGISFELRYNLGLIDLAGKRDGNDKNTKKNSALSFSVGYAFN